MREHYSLAAFLGLSSLALLVFYWPWLFAAANFYVGDNNLYYEPLCRFIFATEALGGNHYSVWNPLLGCGQSLLANPNPSIFYPPNWLFALIPYSRCVGLQLLFHQLVAGLGGFWLAERLRLSRPASFLSGLALALNGFMFSMVDNFSIASTAAWVPLAISNTLGARDICSGRKRSMACVAAGMSLALLILAGRPEIFLPALLALSFIALAPFLNGTQSKAERCARAFPALLAVCSGVLLAMPAVVPAIEWAAHSPRVLNIMRDPLKWSASWYDFISIVCAYPLGNPFWISNPFSLLLQPAAKQLPFVLSPFLGSVVFTLALLGALDRGWRPRRLILLLLALSVVFAAGKNTALVPLLFQILPQLSFCRYPVKLIYFVIFLLTLLAARGADRLFLPEAENRHRMKSSLLRLIVFWFCLLVLSATLYVLAPLNLLSCHEFLSAYTQGAAAEAVRALAASFALWASVALLFLWINWRSYAGDSGGGMQAGHFLSVIIAVLTLILPPCFFARPMADDKFFARPSFAADVINRDARRPSINEDGNTDYRHCWVPPRMVNIVPVEQLGIPPAFHPLGSDWSTELLELYNRQLLEGNVCLDYSIASLFPYEAAGSKELRELELAITGGGSKSLMGLSPDLLAALCRATSTGYVVEQIKVGSLNRTAMPENLFQVVREELALNARIYRTVDALPFVYFVPDWTTVQSSSDAIAMMIKSAEAPFDPSREAILCPSYSESPPPPKASSSRNSVLEKSDFGKISLESWTGDLIEISAAVPSRGCLVVADQIYPGWTATVDGTAVPLYRANALFKAVLLDPGTHRIVMKYEPLSLTLGLALAALGVTMLLALAVAVRLKSRSIDEAGRDV